MVLKMLIEDTESQPILIGDIVVEEFPTNYVSVELNCSKKFCIMIGNGVQIAGIALTLLLYLFIDPSSAWNDEAIPITGMIVSSLLFAIFSGYVNIWLWLGIKQDNEDCHDLSRFSSCVFFIIAFFTYTMLNTIQYLIAGISDISLSTYFTLLVPWILVMVPLTYFGGSLAYRRNKASQFQARNTQRGKETSKGRIWTWFRVLVGGLLPFGTITFELYFSMINIAFGTFREALVAVIIIFILVVISCSIVSVGITYRCATSEDWEMIAFLASASSGIYVFILSVKYLIIDLKGLNGVVSVVVYLGYSVIFCAAVMLFTGAIGFLSAYGFLQILSFLKKLGNPVSVENTSTENGIVAMSSL